MTRLGAPLWVALGLLGCNPGVQEPAPIVLDLAGLSLPPGSESSDQCQSWTLENAEDLWINSVAMNATFGFHHSNWFYVHQYDYQGPDGIWPCATRSFDQLNATMAGGVLFAQSTQAQQEDQKFAPGAAIHIPPRSKIVGTLHLLNASTQTLDAKMTLTLSPIHAEEVTAHLSPMVLQYGPLAIEPMGRSRFSSTCDMPSLFGGPLDFSVYYVLPHYHAYGMGAEVNASDGPSGDQLVFQKTAPIGTVLSESYVPPLKLASQPTLQFSCDYDNPTSSVIGWGNGSAEMCIVVVWQDSGYRWIAGAIASATNTVAGTAADGTILNQAPCTGYRLPEPP